MYFGIGAFIIVATTCLTNLVLFYIILKNNPHSWTNRLLAIFILILASWTFFNVIPMMLKNPEERLFFVRVVMFITAPMAAINFLLALVFPNEKLTINKIVLFCTVLIVTVIAGLGFTPFIFSSLVNLPDGSFTPIAGPAMPFFAINHFGFTILGFVVLYKKLRKSYGILRQQLLLFMIGNAITLILITLSNYIAVVFFGSIKYAFIGPTFTLIQAFFIAYAIVRYKFLDILVIFRRSLIFIFLFGFIVFIFNIIIGILGQYLPYRFQYVISSLVITILFIPLKNFLEILTDKFLFHKPYKLEEAISEYNHILIQNIKIEDLFPRLLNHISNILRVNRAVILIDETKGRFVAETAISSKDKNLTLDNTNPIVQFFNKYSYSVENHVNEFINVENLRYEIMMTVDHELKRKLTLVIDEMHRLDFAVAVPLFAPGGNLISIILLSEKISKDIFNKNDNYFLDVIAHETAFSVENALTLKRLIYVDEIKSEFISVVSHQFRTPLSSARWNLEILLEGTYGKIPVKAREITNDIFQSLINLNKQLSSLLTSIEIESGKCNLNLEKIKFKNNILEPVLKEFQLAIKKKNINIVNNIALSPMLNLDKQKIKTVVEIIIDNAIRYSPVGATVLISDKIIKNDGFKKYQICVDDNGIGVLAQNKDMIFHKFFRGAKAKQMSPDGLGLGMFISNAFMKLHGGELKIEEKKTQGAKICLMLPVID